MESPVNSKYDASSQKAAAVLFLLFSYLFINLGNLANVILPSTFAFPFHPKRNKQKISNKINCLFHLNENILFYNIVVLGQKMLLPWPSFLFPKKKKHSISKAKKMTKSSIFERSKACITLQYRKFCGFSISPRKFDSAKINSR